MGDKYRLLVEGSNDQHLVRRLLERRNIPAVLPRDRTTEPNPIAIQEKGGFEKLRDSLEAELDQPELERLGIIVDADMDILVRWQSVSGVLNKLGGEGVPQSPVTGGTSFTVQRPDKHVQVGIWIMPDNTQPGMLEHFVKSLVPPADTLWTRAEACVSGIPELERRFPPQHEIKALAHTWLSWQEKPGKPFGTAMTAGWLDASSPSANDFIAWIRHLLN